MNKISIHTQTRGGNNLRSSGILRSVYKQFLTDISGKPIGHVLKGQEIQYMTDRFSRNVGKELPV